MHVQVDDALDGPDGRGVPARREGRTPGSPRATTWGTPADREALELLAEEARSASGFDTCAVEVLRGDRMLEFVAIAGSPDGRDALLGEGSPLAVMEPVLQVGAAFGSLRFVAREWMTQAVFDNVMEYGWRPDAEETGDPLDWRPEDMLLAPLLDDRGELRGIAYLDEPVDGRRRDPEELYALSDRLQLTLRAMVTTIEREALAQQHRVLRAARDVIRHASAHTGLDELLTTADTQLREGFGAVDVHLRLPGPGEPRVGPASPDGPLAEPIAAAGRRAWADQQVVIVEPGRVWGDETLEREHGVALASHLRDHDIESLVLAPVGAAGVHLGLLMIALRDHRWTDSASAALLEAGHDLGRAIATARAFEREQQLNAELRDLDTYRLDLISTIAHELRNPIGVISGHLELLAAHDLADGVRRSLTQIGRGADRLGHLAEDLLELGRLGHASAPADVLVDLDRVVAEVVEFHEVMASHHGVEVRVEPGTGAVPRSVRGDRDELQRMVSNLVSNAVKYSAVGDTVRLSVTRSGGEVELRCADEGIGISREDLEGLFTEFFRSTNADALSRPGTGLGLTIVQRIVARHGGRVEVDSELGVGTTFRVVLPDG